MKNKEIKLGDMLVTTFTPPPENFDPVAASDRERLVHGIPEKPDALTNPQLNEWWHSVYSKPLQHVTPEFKINEKNKSANDASLKTWSGVALQGGLNYFRWIAANWNVTEPNSPAGRCDGNTYYVSSWIGIDGTLNAKQDVLQAGVRAKETCNGGQVSRDVYVWWEWWPGPEIAIPGIPVKTGDFVYCLICVRSPLQASFYIVNMTQNKHTSFTVSAPLGTVLLGKTAEFIVERPTLNNIYTQLADYGEIVFSNAGVGTPNNGFQYAGSGLAYNMEDDFGNTTSVGTILSQSQVKCDYVLTDLPPFFMAWKGSGSDQGIYYSYYDGNFWYYQQRLNKAATSTGPAMAFYNDSIFMIWKGVDGDAGIYFSFLEGDLKHSPAWLPQGSISGVSTSYKPCAAVYKGRLYAAWKGYGDDHGIYFAIYVSNWAPQQNIPNVGTSLAPTIVEFQDSLFVAWRGEDDDQGIYYTSWNGTGWDSQHRIDGVATSGSPCLAVYAGQLYIAWKGADDDEGIFFTSYRGDYNWNPQQNVGGVGTAVGPALIPYGDKLYMSWRGIVNDGGLLNDEQIYYSFYDGNIWYPQQQALGFLSSVGPALAAPPPDN